MRLLVYYFNLVHTGPCGWCVIERSRGVSFSPIMTTHCHYSKGYTRFFIHILLTRFKSQRQILLDTIYEVCCITLL